jgi:hypothetical protein
MRQLLVSMHRTDLLRVRFCIRSNLSFERRMLPGSSLPKSSLSGQKPPIIIGCSRMSAYSKLLR